MGISTIVTTMDTKKPFDPLLNCLVAATKLFEKPFTEETLTAGLPLVDGKLTVDIFPRAARHGNVEARPVKVAIDKITAEHLPIILLLEDKQACLLKEFTSNGTVQVIFPENITETVSVNFEDLAKRYSGFAILIKPIYQFDSRAESPSLFRSKHWFWKVVREYWGSYSEVLIASLIINLFVLAVPLFIRSVYNRVLPNAAMETLWVLAIGMLIVVAFDLLMRSLRAYFIDHAARDIDKQLSAKTFEQVLGLKMSARPNSVGSLANTLYAFESFREFITSASISLLVDIPFALLFIFVIFLMSPAVAMVPMITIPLIILNSYLVQRPLQDLVAKSYQHAAEKQALLVESLVGAETLKALHAEGPRQSRWERIIDQSSDVNLKQRMLVNYGMNFSIAMQIITTVGITIVSVYMIMNGSLSAGSLIACMILGGRATAPIVQLSTLMIRYKQTRAALDGLDKIMTAEVDRPEGKSYLQHSEVKGAVEFDTVSFTYPGQKIPALSSVSFKITPGEHIGIIGHMGSGKTTINKLILNLYQANSGKILIDGLDINQIDPAEFRSKVGYVPQNISLFHGSIRDNIAMAAPFATDEQILRAAKISGVYSFVNQHPDGFDRQVGERGEFLSGGQKQAIAIARAVLMDPDIYVFDEPTGALDNLGLKNFIINFHTMLKEKTLILVSHKASLLQLVDRLIVMDHGQKIADGPRDKIIRLLQEGQEQSRSQAASAKEGESHE